MFGTPLIAFSISEATVCSSTSAEAPGYTACTVTTGGAISGYCAIGRLRIAARPASTMKMETTAAKMRSEEHTSELQSLAYLVCRLLLEKKKKKRIQARAGTTT